MSAREKTSIFRKENFFLNKNFKVSYRSKRESENPNRKSRTFCVDESSRDIREYRFACSASSNDHIKRTNFASKNHCKSNRKAFANSFKY